MNTPLTQREIVALLNRVPQEVCEPILKRGVSRWTIPIDIVAASDTLVETALHDLVETIEETKLYWGSRSGRGTVAQMEYKLDGAVATSYKRLYWAEVDDSESRATIGGVKKHELQNVQVTLYCEPYWHPTSTTNLVNAVTKYNHDDGAHDNFVDILAANILGDVEPRLKVVVKETASKTLKWLYLATRAAGTPGNFDHWLDAEDYTAKGGSLSVHADADRCDGEVLQATSGTTSWLYWQITTNKGDQRGRFRAYLSVWTNDKDNTKFRLRRRWGYADLTEATFDWQYVGKASTWQLIYLGTVQNPVVGALPYTLAYYIDYEKDDADTIEIDYLLLLPDDESASRLESGFPITSLTANNDQMIFDDTGDFLQVECRRSADSTQTNEAALSGPPLTLAPGKDNRVYVKFLAISAADDDPYKEHLDQIDNGGTPNSIQLTIDYLPQYLTPIK